MTADTKEVLKQMLENLSRIDYIHPADLPGIDLYMDQVTTFMDDKLSSTKRYPEDKILTKTMINNYAKNHLLPSPNKKKYSNEHLMVLIFIYYLKNILSISDIQTILEPLTEHYFQAEDGRNLADIYEEIFRLQKSQLDVLAKDLTRQCQLAAETFQEAPEEEREALQHFSLISLLTFDVYAKKMLIEKLIDRQKAASAPEPKPPKKTKGK